MIDLEQSEARRLKILRASGLLAAEPVPELDDLCRRAQGYFGVRVALVTLIDENRQVLLAAAGTRVRETPRNLAFCDHTIRRDEVLVVQDATRDPRFRDNPMVRGEPFIRFYAGAPLTYLEDARLGSFCLLDMAPRELTPNEQADLALTAESVVGLLLERIYETTFPRLVA